MATILGHYRVKEATDEVQLRNLGSVHHYSDYKIADRHGNIDGRQGLWLGKKAGVEVLEEFQPKIVIEVPVPDSEPPLLAEEVPQKKQRKTTVLNIQREAADRFQSLAQDAQITGRNAQTRMLVRLMDRYEQQEQTKEALSPAVLGMSSPLVEDIARYLSESKTDFLVLIKTAVEREVNFRKGLVKRTQQQEEKDYTQAPTSALAKARAFEASIERIRRVVLALVMWNHQTQDRRERWFINQSVVQQLSTAPSSMVKRFFRVHQEQIDQYNAEFEVTGATNYKRPKVKTIVPVPDDPQAFPRELLAAVPKDEDEDKNIPE